MSRTSMLNICDILVRILYDSFNWRTFPIHMFFPMPIFLLFPLASMQPCACVDATHSFDAWLAIHPLSGKFTRHWVFSVAVVQNPPQLICISASQAKLVVSSKLSILIS